ncbi:hypothetical protein OHT59_10335 [Streptomyces sp. NBC_00243]|uniref:hypothetical protein n=1 Tax=Streptomyces sp. NBC_00243 TaxID=2975688 RepID=UPI002DDC0D08|nr:hypothetical protein [Streptomyces sp. NBC_00243]WRZ18860.1 hypothetical protein OHT59_10335 [Streptomyces sp. NBC_00243]
MPEERRRSWPRQAVQEAVRRPTSGGWTWSQTIALIIPFVAVLGAILTYEALGLLRPVLLAVQRGVG